MARFDADATLAFLTALRARPRAVPHWPAEWGGGLPVDQKVVL